MKYTINELAVKCSILAIALLMVSGALCGCSSSSDSPIVLPSKPPVEMVVTGSYNTVLALSNARTWTKSGPGTSFSTTVKRYVDVFTDVIKVGKYYYLIGTSGVRISNDAITWSLIEPRTQLIPQRIAYGNGTFVLVGRGGLIQSSPNGWSWVTRTSGVSDQLQGVTFGANGFVAVGMQGVILTSPDGTSWTKRVSGKLSKLNAVVAGKGMYVVAGDMGIILTSPDGVTWTDRYLSSGTNKGLFGAGFAAETFLVVGNDGTILTSPDSITWTQRTSGVTTNLTAVGRSKTSFTVVGHAGVVLTSNDGISWTKLDTGVLDALHGVL